VNLGLPVFTEANDDGSGGDNWTTGAINHAKLQSNHHQQTNYCYSNNIKREMSSSLLSKWHRHRLTTTAMIWLLAALLVQDNAMQSRDGKALLVASRVHSSVANVLYHQDCRCHEIVTSKQMLNNMYPLMWSMVTPHLTITLTLA